MPKLHWKIHPLAVKYFASLPPIEYTPEVLDYDEWLHRSIIEHRTGKEFAKYLIEVSGAELLNEWERQFLDEYIEHPTRSWKPPKRSSEIKTRTAWLHQSIRLNYRWLRDGSDYNHSEAILFLADYHHKDEKTIRDLLKNKYGITAGSEKKGS